MLRKSLKVMIVLGLMVALTAPLAAQEKKKKQKKRQQANFAAQLMKQLEKAELSAEQKEKLKGIVAEYRPKMQEVQKKLALTPEQRKARTAATKEATEKGLKGKARRDAIDAAAKLSDEQKSAQEAQRKMQGEFRTAVMALLSDEQKEKAGLRQARRKKKKNG